MQRCPWPGTDPLYIDYHDHEWGVPIHDDRMLWEKLILDGFQAGLSWITILRKRDHFIRAFDGFHPERIATYGESDVEQLMQDAGIIRNQAKIRATIGNAKAYLELIKEQSFSDFLWDFVGAKPKVNHFRTLSELPAKSQEAEAMSKALKARGFKFVGPTICYAFMQAVGMVNDHLVDCPRWKEVQEMD